MTLIFTTETSELLVKQNSEFLSVIRVHNPPKQDVEDRWLMDRKRNKNLNRKSFFVFLLMYLCPSVLFPLLPFPNLWFR